MFRWILLMRPSVTTAVLLLLSAIEKDALAGQPPVEAKIRQPEPGTIATMTHEVKPFGKTNDGQEVKLRILSNLKGLRVKLIDYGATLIGVETPDKNGKLANITLS